MKANRFTLAAATMCAAMAALNANSVQAQRTPQTELQELFEYSKLAINPSDHENEVTECDRYVDPWDERTAVSIPDDVINQIEERLDGVEYEESPPTTQRWPGGIENSLVVECRGNRHFMGTALKVFAADEGLFIQTEAVAGRVDREERVKLQPAVSEGRTIIFPGTDIGDPRQVLANFRGEGCVFNAARIAVDTLCAAYNTDRQSLQADNTHRGPATLAGHSLGGATVQYITLRAANEPEDTDEWMCPEVKGYAFGSIGVSEQAATGYQNVVSRLKTYVSQCDRVTNLFSSDGRQTGRITIKTGSKMHGIHEIQADICGCIMGEECIQHRPSAVGGPPTNTSIQMPCQTQNEDGA